MLINIILKCVIVYIIVFLALKFMGKREVGQVSLFDFAIILIISDILVIGIDENNEYFWFYFIGVITLVLIQRIISLILLKFKKIRKFFDGEESVLIYEGRLNIKEMKKQRYNMDDLISQLRLNNISSLKEIKYLILENNGNISCFKYVDKPLNPFPLIVSGELEEKNLKLLNIKESWINTKLDEKHLKREDVYYASYENNDLYVVPLYKGEG